MQGTTKSFISLAPGCLFHEVRLARHGRRVRRWIRSWQQLCSISAEFVCRVRIERRRKSQEGLFQYETTIAGGGLLEKLYKLTLDAESPFSDRRGIRAPNKRCERGSAG